MKVVPLIHDLIPVRMPEVCVPELVEEFSMALGEAAHSFDAIIANSAHTAADIGASTGGFTDVLLTNGAAKVFAVDVGYGELAWKIQKDPRVVVLDRTNARYLTKEQVPDPLDIVVTDVSFISLTVALPPALSLLKKGGYFVALIKPQFEVAPEEVPDGGIITDPLLHENVCTKIKGWIEDMPGFTLIGITESPIKGGEGNKEFLLAARYGS
ncbi:MAG: TlyA family rRNA (cytidine-2'-O)-methyltransferase [Proteobacteria bacterium]|nr:TlyA family rRNA (cytidine-2'-O)-methyltransferase [Pseudomonadota bacterium]